MSKNINNIKTEVPLVIDEFSISQNSSTYFIADIAANHDGDLSKAIDLIYAAKEAGAHAAKFQHFNAKTIVSDKGFRDLEGKLAHQSGWKKSVYEVYEDASISNSWTEVLSETCRKAGISFFSSPYSFELVDHIDRFVPAYKIGSGDITWTQIIEYIAKKDKPVIIATGASNIDEVKIAVDTTAKYNDQIALLQCNTNYTGADENMNYINLNVLNTYKKMFPGIVLGLSDHTKTHTSVLGAVALGAKIIEKHFTLNNDLEGPDHSFSLTPLKWREMVDMVRELESNLGNGIKKVEDNEIDSIIVQRRSIRSNKLLRKGHVIKFEDLDFLRPCPEGSLKPSETDIVIGKTLIKDIEEGEAIQGNHLL